MKIFTIIIFLFATSFAQNNWWQQYSSPTNLFRGVSFVDANIGTAVGSNGTTGIILRTTNGGTSWTPQNSGENVSLHDVSFVDANYGTVVGDSGKILHTTNGGTTWVTQNSGTTNILRGVSFVDANIGTVVGDSGKILRTTNGGTTWVTQNSGTTRFLSDVYFVDNNIGTAVALDGGPGSYTLSFRTTNGGTTWVSSTVGTPNGLNGVCFVDANIGTVVGGFGKIYRTTNGGSSWVSQNSGNTVTINDVYFVDANNGTAVGESGYIRSTTNGGQGWVQQNSGTSTDIYAISSAGLNMGQYAVGDHGIFTPMFCWNTDLYISDAGSTHGIISFGQSSFATIGIDPLLGENELPPPPPTGIFDARFQIPSTQGSLKDYRSTNDSIVWNISFQPSTSGYPINFTWSSDFFPSRGNIFLKDAFGLINVNMKTSSSYILTNTGIASLKIVYVYSPPVTKFVNVLAGWNMLSVPVRSNIMNAAYLFPTLAAPFYSFDNGYHIVVLLENSKGYWAKFNSNENVQITGNIITPPNIPVKNSWNLIGPFNFDVSVSNITSTPSNIIATPFYSFNNGYQTENTLSIGKGYWVRTNQPGTLHLNTLSKSPPTETEIQSSLADIVFTITDGAGGIAILKAGIDSLGTDGLDLNLGELELPPLPPVGVFDARFNLPNSTISSFLDYRQGNVNGGYQRIHEMQYQLGNGTSITINYNFGQYSASQIKGRLQDVVTGTLIDTTISGVGTYTVSNPGAFNKLKLTLNYDQPLPVELSAFNAIVENNNVNLGWSTATETNNKGFSIERKISEDHWKEIVFVPSMGSSSKPTNYSYVDKSLSSGIYFYRLKQIDFDGTSKFSSSVQVTIALPTKFELSQNFANPFNPTTTIRYAIPEKGFVELKVYDILGKEVSTLVNEEKEVGNYKSEFDGSALSNGVYFYQLLSGSFIETKKMILMK